MPIFSSSVRPKCELLASGYKSFSTGISQNRLAAIQSLLSPDEVLLVVCGIDSHFNQGSQRVFEFLLFNVTQKRAAEIERTKLDDESFDDVVLAIGRSSVSVYLNPVNYWFYLPYIACWPALDIHCAPDQMFEDTDAMEEFKMNFLLQAVARSKTVCVSFYGRDHMHESSQFNPMLIEKWPLVQAYAVEGFGVGTFFTLKHEVRDISREVLAVLQSVDPVAIEELSEKPLKSFKHQFDSTFQALDYLVDRNDPKLLIADKSLDQLMEPYRSYAKHAMTGRAAPSAVINESSSKGIQTTSAYIAFDNRKATVRQLTKGNAGDCSKPFGSAALPASFIIHAEDRFHSLACTRTCFLHWSLPDANKQLQRELDVFNRDLNYVNSRMTEIVRTRMRGTDCDTKFDQFAAGLTVELSQQLGIPASLIEVSTELMQPTALPGNRMETGFPHLRSVSCFVFDLTPETLNEASWCGTVALCDTYFVTSGSGTWTYPVTDCIPTACHWSGDCALTVQRHLAAATTSGNATDACAIRLADLAVTVESTGAEMTAICLRSTKNPLLLVSQREVVGELPLLVGIRVLPGGDSLDKPCRLEVDFQDNHVAPAHLMTTIEEGADSTRRALVLRMPAGGRAKRDFFAKVAPIWRADGLLTIEATEEKGEMAARDEENSVAKDATALDTAETNDTSEPAGAILIWGHLGSYAENLAYELVNSGHTRLVDLLHCASVEEAASQFRAAAALETSDSVVVLCPHLIPPESLLSVITLQVTSVVVCANAATALVSARCRFQFGLLDCLADGACSVLALTADLPESTADAAATSAASVESELTRLFRLTNQSAKVIRAPTGRLTAGNIRRALSPPEVSEWRKLRQRRSHSLVRTSSFELSRFGLSRVSVEFFRPLDRDRFTERLSSLKQRFFADTTGSGGPKFVYLSGTAPVKSGQQVQQVTFWRHCPTDAGARMSLKANFAGAGRVVAFGIGIADEDLKRFLRLCAPLRPIRKAMMIRSDLTPAAIARIHKERHLDTLPEGWFFNGTKYISFDGESTKTHPSLEKFLEEHIAQENKKIGEYNAKLGDSDWRDLFDD